jgi:integrase/recombinase XerD
MSAKFYGGDRSPERACRKLKDWPEADRRSWLASLEPRDLLDVAHSRCRYRATSNRKTERGYGRWLTFIDRQGELDGLPADRITPSALARYVHELRSLGNGSYSILCRLQELYDAARVMDARRDWSWIHRVASRVRVRQVRVRDKRVKLVGTEDLLDLGLGMIDGAIALPNDRRRAITFRDGLIVAFLALRPLRIKNLAGLTLDRHLEKVGDTWVVHITPEETKASTPLEFPWPELLVPSLQLWLSRWRPVLCSRMGRWARPAEPALWISCDGSRMTMRAIYDRIVRITHEAFGVAINPHFFRDIAVTTLAFADPERVRVAAQLLGHRSFATTEQYYLQASMMGANRRRQASLLRLRHSSPYGRPHT